MFFRSNILGIIKTITWLRFSNWLVLLVSYFYSRITRKAIHKGMPFSISIEPTTSCNLRCPQCPSGLRSFSRNTGMISVDLYKKIVDELAPTLSYLTLYFQGEPLLHPQLNNLIKLASEKKIFVATSTNAHHLSEVNCIEIVNSGLSRLIISIDGVTQESYSQYRVGGNLSKVIEGTKNILLARIKAKSLFPQVIWQFIVFKHNENQIEKITELGKSIGVDKIMIKTAQIYNYKEGDNWIPENKKLSRYEMVMGGYTLQNKLLNHCWRMWQGCVFTWDGHVVPCCFDKDASHTLGNVVNSSFKEIWTNAAYTNFRQTLFYSRDKIDICQNCSEGTKIWTDL